jgi:hypothetical protein
MVLARENGITLSVDAMWAQVTCITSGTEPLLREQVTSIQVDADKTSARKFVISSLPILRDGRLQYFYSAIKHISKIPIAENNRHQDHSHNVVLSGIPLVVLLTKQVVLP